MPSTRIAGISHPHMQAGSAGGRHFEMRANAPAKGAFALIGDLKARGPLVGTIEREVGAASSRGSPRGVDRGALPMWGDFFLADSPFTTGMKKTLRRLLEAVWVAEMTHYGCGMGIGGLGQGFLGV